MLSKYKPLQLSSKSYVHVTWTNYTNTAIFILQAIEGLVCPSKLFMIVHVQSGVWSHCKK